MDNLDVVDSVYFSPFAGGLIVRLWAGASRESFTSLSFTPE